MQMCVRHSTRKEPYVNRYTSQSHLSDTLSGAYQRRYDLRPWACVRGDVFRKMSCQERQIWQTLPYTTEAMRYPLTRLPRTQFYDPPTLAPVIIDTMPFPTHNRHSCKWQERNDTREYKLSNIENAQLSKIGVQYNIQMSYTSKTYVGKSWLS